MGESFSNTNPSAYTTPAIQPAAGNTPVSGTTVTQPTQAATTVDMTNTEQAVTAIQKGEETKPSHLNIGEDYTIPTGYINAHKQCFYSNQPTYTYDENSDVSYAFGNSLNNKEKLKNSFFLGFIRQKAEGDGYIKSRQLFASLDNQNYTYGRLHFQGSWINTRTPIDENGNATGLPEMLPA